MESVLNDPGSAVDPLAHPICLSWPKRRTAVRSWHEHIPFAMFLVDLLRPAVLVELGVHAGDSYCAFCQAVRELDLDTRCYGIDTWEGDPHAGVYDAGVLDDLRAHHDPLYGGFSRLVRSTFDEARDRFPDGTIGLLHIDGYHAYDAVKHDFEAWLPKLRADGVVLLHDTSERARGFGVGRFWEEIKPQYPHFEFHHGHGLGVLAVGDVVSPALASLLHAKPDAAEHVRAFFAHLGQRLSLRDDLDALERRFAEVQERSAPNQLQLYWSAARGFSEATSLSLPLVADDKVHQHVFALPAAARGPLRLDPGHRPAYVEIHAIELVAGEVRRRWSPAEGDTRLILSSGVTRLPGRSTYRLLCRDDDPQLILDGVPDRADADAWLLRVTLRASERPLDVLAAEVSRLERRHARLRRRRRDDETDLAVARTRLADQETATRALTARAAEHAEALAAAQAEWRAERESLNARLADHERERQSRLDELARARELVQRLESSMAEDQDALRAVRDDNARLGRQAEAAAAAARALAADVEAREDLLRRIAVSRGWRALNRYRGLKHRLIRSVRLVARVGELLGGREYRPRLYPSHELRRLGETEAWESSGRDPQFNVSGPWPAGWAEVTLAIEVDGDVSGRARLYVDRGAGYSERDSYELGEGTGRRTRFVPLGPEVIALRLDPFESAGRFRIATFTLKRVTARRARLGTSALAASPTAPAPAPPAAKVAAVPFPVDPYEAWLEVNEWNPRRAAWLAARLASLTEPPLVSVVMPVYDPAPEFLERAIASVAAQVYARWELCIADDASTDPAVRQTLGRWAERDPRIRVVFREVNGHISRATNSAAELARGEFLAFMDHDDELAPDALGEVALYLAEHPDTDVLYSDDDKIDARGRRFAPQFKPDWSPELLLSYMYWSHLLVVRRRVFTEAGGLRAGYEGAQDYDLALRIADATDRVGHLAKVLYHWRAVPGSTAASGRAKPESFGAGLRAVQEALDRRGARGVAQQPPWAVAAGCGIFAHEFPDAGPRVAVIIPTRNNVTVLRACLASLERTTYENYEVVVVDNASDDEATLAFLAETRHRVLRIPSPGGRFNFAAINNEAVEATDADLVLFLNDDTEVIAPRWLSQMVGYLGLPGVGAVGARLRFPDGRLQHAGIVRGYYHGLAGPAFKLLPATGHGYLSYAMVARDYGAVTAACLLTRRDLFRRLGGFDALRFGVAYNDVDFCYRLGAAGYRSVYCPTAELVHHEGASRGFVDDPAEPAAFRRTYGGRPDPYYNPNLSLDHERFAVDARTIAPDRLPPIRALMCAFNLNWEGAPYSQFELTVGLAEAGVIDPVVYCPQDGPLRALYEAAGIRVERFESPLRRVREPSEYEAAVAHFAEWIRAAGVDLVYGNTRQTFYAIDAAKRAGLPSIWNLRESEPWDGYFDYLGPKLTAYTRPCLAYPYKVVFVAEATRRSCAPLETHHNFTTIHTGLDRQRFGAALGRWPRAEARRALGAGSDDVVLLSLGTVCERKGQIDVVDALARLPEDTAGRIRCFIVGDRPGGYSDRLKAAWDALPAARRSRVEIAAETADTGAYYAAADVFVCTSRIESYPRVILEGMAAGLPIVTTPVYGIAEQVRDNVNALCYAPGDAPALAAHLDRLARDPELRRRLGDGSRHVLDILNDFDAMVAAYARVFREAWWSGRPR